MKASKFLSNYLKVDSFQGQGEQTCTIRSCREETLGFGERANKKLVLYFAEIEQGLALNKTNLKRLIKGFGTDDTEAWVGRKVRMAIEEVPDPQGGGTTDGIVARAV